MELVYLWVDNYKNIRNQGFNFSPRFECEFKAEYDEDKKLKNDCELKITPKEHIENFFGKDINVTAIVGENGSGKSTIFECLIKLYNVGYLINNDYSFFIFYEKEEFFIMNNLYRHTTNKEIEFIIKSGHKINQPTEEKSKKQIYEYKLGIGDKNYLNLSSEIFYKKYLNVSQEFKEHFYFNKFSFFMNIDNINSKLFTHNKPIHYEDESLLKIQDKINNKEILLYKILNISIYLYIRKEERYLINNEYNEKIKKLYNKISKSEITCFNNFQDVLKIYKEFMEEKYYTYFLEKNKIENFFSFFEFVGNEKKLIVKVENFEEYQNVFLKNEISNFLNNLKLIELDMHQENNKFYNYSNFSDGEKHYFGSLVNFYNDNLENKFQDKIILIDELELYLHPNWQKTFFNLILGNLEKNKLKVNLLMTTHSPFILSDLPKENVIFLNKFDEKDKEELKIKYPKLNLNGLENGNCINVSKYIELKTFGANIHTLLSDGFFMSDGLMGEFAKSKISEIKKFYELIQNLQNKGKIKNKNLWKKSYERRKTRFENIQKIIGEPFLQTIIKNYLDDLYLTFSDDKTLIDKELAELEKRKKQLESLKNAKN
jgi:predicted ATP-binding protein involved in virulence